MKQVFIVMEGNGESYEDYQSWAVAAFSNAEDANEHMEDLTKGYDMARDIAQELSISYEEDSNALYAAIPYDWNDDEYYGYVIPGINEYLDSKYPGVSDMDYYKHSFFVSEPVPFIK